MTEVDSVGNSNRGSRKRGILAFAAGFITMIAGYATWKSPQLNSDAFLQALQQFLAMPTAEITKMIAHPFSLIGLIVLSVGVIMTLIGIKEAIAS